MNNIDKQALAEEWGQHIKAALAHRDVIKVDEVRAWFAERGVPDPLNKRSSFYHVAYTPLFKDGFRKMHRGDFVRANVIALEVKPSCVKPCAPTSAHVQPPLRSALQDLSGSDAATAEVSPVSSALALRADFEDGAPRVRDVDLASFLGFERPREIRRLIDRHDGGLGPRVTVTRVINGGKTEESWLTEEQAVYIVAKSETPRANELLRHVIAVFVAWRNGRLAPSPPQLPPVVDLLAKMQEQSDRKFERLMAAQEQTFGRFMSIMERLIPVPTTDPKPAPPTESAPHTQKCGPMGQVDIDGYIEVERVPPNYFALVGYMMGAGIVLSDRRTLQAGRTCLILSDQMGLSRLKKWKQFGRKGMHPEHYWHIEVLKKVFAQAVA